MKCAPNELYFVSQFPYLAFSKEQVFLNFVNFQIREGLELKHILIQYPTVKYQYLDFYYLCYKALKIFDEDVLNDLVESKNWRFILIASWLSCLSPNPKYIQYLKLGMYYIKPEHSLLLNIAINFCDNHFQSETIHLIEKINQFKEILNVNKFNYFPTYKLTEKEKICFENSDQYIKKLKDLSKEHGIDHAIYKFIQSPIFIFTRKI